MKTKHTLIAAFFALAGTAAYAQTAPPMPGPEEHHELRQDHERAEKRAEEHHEMARDRQQMQMHEKAAKNQERELRARREREAHEHEMHEHEMREHMEH